LLLLTTTLIQHLLGLGAEEFSEWMKLAISLFCNLPFLWLWGWDCYWEGFVFQRRVVLRPLSALLPHTTSFLSLLCRREVQFHWTHVHTVAQPCSFAGAKHFWLGNRRGAAQDLGQQARTMVSQGIMWAPQF